MNSDKLSERAGGVAKPAGTSIPALACPGGLELAVGVRFELTVALRQRRFSRPLPSTTRPSHRSKIHCTPACPHQHAQAARVRPVAARWIRPWPRRPTAAPNSLYGLAIRSAFSRNSTALSSRLPLAEAPGRGSETIPSRARQQSKEPDHAVRDLAGDSVGFRSTYWSRRNTIGRQPRAHPKGALALPRASGSDGMAVAGLFHPAGEIGVELLADGGGVRVGDEVPGFAGVLFEVVEL